MHDPRLHEDIAEARYGRADWIFGRHSVCPYDWNFSSEVQLPLRGEPEGCVDPGERRAGFDPFGRPLFGAWTGRLGIAVKKLDLAQRLSWIVPGSVFEFGAIRAGKNRARHAQ